jgi:NitT/TauT family transport system permease protein
MSARELEGASDPSKAPRDAVPLPTTSGAKVPRGFRLRPVHIGQLAPLALLLLVWQLGAGTLFDRSIFSTPLEVGGRLIELFGSSQFYSDANITLSAIGLGYGMGLVAGTLLAFAAWRYDVFDRIVQPYLIGLNSVPKVALAPLFLIWFGIGIASKVAVAFVMVFFLVFYSVYTGLKSLDRDFVDLAQIMGCNDRKVFREVIFPSAMPYILAGARIAMPYAVIGVVIGEFSAATRGLGYRILYSAGTFDSAGVYAHIIVLVALTLLVSALVGWIEKRAVRWRPQRERRGAAA